MGISRQIAQWCLTVSASGGTAAAADAVVVGADRNSNAPELKTIITKKNAQSHDTERIDFTKQKQKWNTI